MKRDRDEGKREGGVKKEKRIWSDSETKDGDDGMGNRDRVRKRKRRSEAYKEERQSAKKRRENEKYMTERVR